MSERPDYLRRLEEHRGVSCAVCNDHGCEFCPDARRQDLLDRLSPFNPDEYETETRGLAYELHRDERGTVDVRVLATVAAVLAVALVVWLAWPYLVGVAVIAAGWRVATRHTRRKRPRSSWSSLGRTAALMYAAWNSRWLKGSTFKASVPARVGAGHACGECGTHLDDVAPF